MRTRLGGVGQARPVMPTADPDPRAVLTAFGLPGAPLALVEVDGAWSNRVLRLRTTDGDYAVKELRNPWGEPRWREWLDESWRLELAVLAAGVGVPEPVPVPGTGECVAYVARAGGAGDLPVRLHRWVEGARPGPGPVPLDVARWAGRTLATVHALGLEPRDPMLFPRPGTWTADTWPDLVARTRAAGVGWWERLASAQPVVRRAADLLPAPDGSPTVLTHGDLDQKNLLVTSAGPLLCDWDVAVPHVREHDLADVAVSLAAWRDRSVARAVLGAYAAAGGRARPPRPQDVGLALMVRLDWIAFCVDRASGVRAADPDETARAASLVPGLLRELEHQVRVAESLDTWLA